MPLVRSMSEASNSLEDNLQRLVSKKSFTAFVWWGPALLWLLLICGVLLFAAHALPGHVGPADQFLASFLGFPPVRRAPGRNVSRRSGAMLLVVLSRDVSSTRVEE